jgi:hypothetical protein
MHRSTSTARFGSARCSQELCDACMACIRASEIKTMYVVKGDDRVVRRARLQKASRTCMGWGGRGGCLLAWPCMREWCGRRGGRRGCAQRSWGGCGALVVDRHLGGCDDVEVRSCASVSVRFNVCEKEEKHPTTPQRTLVCLLHIYTIRNSKATETYEYMTSSTSRVTFRGLCSYFIVHVQVTSRHARHGR